MVCVAIYGRLVIFHAAYFCYIGGIPIYLYLGRAGLFCTRRRFDTIHYFSHVGGKVFFILIYLL